MRESFPGFTLIELLVVLAIIAILALMAAPVYTNKLVSNQIVTALPLADIAKGPVAAAWAAAQAFPADNGAAGLPSPDRIVNNQISSVTIADGAIHVTFGNNVHALLRGKILTLRPAVVEDAPVVPVTWVCGNATAPDKMTIKGENKTTIATAYLPLNCRAATG